MSYCHQPEHRYSTRYKTSGNYVLPNSNTNRGQYSIKFSGPKAWAKVPNEYKEIAFRKSFSKKFKKHVLDTIFVDLPTKRTKNYQKNSDNNPDNLGALFESEDEEGEFFGFDKKLTTLFESEDEVDEFLGFGTQNDINLALIFQEDNVEEEFFGF